jgi:hypothetical protein
MTYEGVGGDTGGVTQIPPYRETPHYHGDEARVIFVVAALVIIVAESTGANLPLSTTGSVSTAILLIIAAGITNPAQSAIHWFNALLAISGTLLFGTAAINNYRAGMSVFDTSFASIEALTLLALLSLYFTTRTIRGLIQRPTLE